MNSPRPKRGQDFEGADSSSNAQKRARLELRLDGCEAPDTVINENGHWDRDLNLVGLSTQGCGTAELDFSSFDDNFDFPILENLVPCSDVASAEYLPISVQPEVQQSNEHDLVCYGAVCPRPKGLAQFSADSWSSFLNPKRHFSPSVRQFRGKHLSRMKKNSSSSKLFIMTTVMDCYQQNLEFLRGLTMSPQAGFNAYTLSLVAM
jgi:hypothetical protein